MRKQLEPVGQDQTLTDVLAQVGPPGLGAFLQAGAGFRVRLGGVDARAQRADGGRRYRLSGTDLVADVAIEVVGELGVAVQSVSLTNEGGERSPEIELLEPMFLPLTVRLKDCPVACGFGGGLTDGFYPPGAYRQQRVSFGKARDWDPTDSDFHRW